MTTITAPPTFDQFASTIRELQQQGAKIDPNVLDPTYWGEGNGYCSPEEASEGRDAYLFELLQELDRALLGKYAGVFYPARDRHLAVVRREEAQAEQEEAAGKARKREEGRKQWEGGLAAKVAAHVVQATRESQPATPAKKLERFWLYDQAFEMGLTRAEFMVYAYLARRAGKSGICWPSIASIVEACHMDRKTVRRAIKRLRKPLRMVAWKRGSFGRSSKYRLTEPTLWKTITGPVGGPVVEGSE